MRNIFLFIRRFANFFLFLLLQIICIITIVRYSRFHEAVFGSMANRVTGKINRQYNSVDDFLKLRKTNDSLVKANEMLYNKLKENYGIPDSVSPRVIDTINVDSLRQYRIFTYLNAKVIASTTASPSNYVVMFGDNVPKMRKGMGVIDANNGVIGQITEIDGKYAVVMGLLHKDSHLSGKLFKGGETGTVSWDGKLTNILTLSNIPKSAKVAVGDSVITSGLSSIFPRGIMMGTVSEVINAEGSNFYTLKLRSTADFTNLQFGYAIENVHQETLQKIQQKLKLQGE